MKRPILAVIEDVKALANQVEDARHTLKLLLLAQRAHRPESFVVMVGETGTGKSTLINGLLGARILPSAAGPSTGTVTQVICRTTPSDRRIAIYKDGVQAELDEATFASLSENPAPELLRLQFHTDRAGRSLQGLNVIDTPGYNALVAEHDEILREFLPDSDAVVFVAGYRTGFGQTDQDLYEAVAQATSDDATMPLFLVVNRTPDAVGMKDKRVVEIKDNATDSLRREPRVLLIRSAPLAVAGAPAALPDVSALWTLVSEAARSESRVLAVQAKLGASVSEICEDMKVSILTCLDADAAGTEEVEAQLALLHKGRQDSLAAVEKCMVRLRSFLPALVRHEKGRMEMEVAKVVNESGKWLGQPDCTAFVVEHALPFEGRAACRAIGNAIATALAELDRELEEIANTTITQLRQRITPTNDVASRMATDLARVLAKRAFGEAAVGLLIARGGVGGVAAGAGNYVKMAVKRVGQLFDKTFGREVYAQIGRLFNKRAVQALGAAAFVAIEATFLLWDIHHWQAQIKERAGKAIEKWETDVVREIVETYIPQIKQSNVGGVHLCYDDMIEAAEAGRKGLDPKRRVALRSASLALVEIIKELQPETQT
jgi:energy-coupling factor transporter ATP-binding protein EcfA2